MIRPNMRNVEEHVKNLYLKDEYIVKNPSLHEKDSPWKVSKLIPLVDKLVEYLDKDEINLLDVGGGAGLILDTISTYIEKKHGIKVNKFALDSSPGMLKIQKARNPDIKKALNEDIRKTSLDNKEIDLTLMIDLLEHVSDPIEALNEVKRISNFVIFKVPLEDNLVFKAWNFIKRGKPRQEAIETIGHINIYRFRKCKYGIEKYTGQILDYYFTNVFGYFRDSEYYRKKMTMKSKLINFLGAYIFKLSPKLCSFIFNDFVMILVKCYTLPENRSGFNIAVVTLPFDKVRNSSEVILVNFLQTLEPLSNNIFAITGNLSPYPNKKTKLLKLKTWQMEEKLLLFKILNHLLVDLQISFNLLKISNKVDIVFFHIGARVYLVSALLSKLLRKKIIAFSFSSASKIAEVSASQNVIKRSQIVSLFLAVILQKFVFHLVDQIAVEAENVIEFSNLKSYRGKIRIYGVPYVDLNLFKVEKEIKDRKEMVGYIGGLSALKGVQNLAKAIPLVLEKKRDVMFLIGGDGPLLSGIKEELKANNAFSKVKFVGWIPHNGVPNYLNEIKLLVLPSYTEGSPGIVREAMACGTPVLATPVGGVPDVIKDGKTGFIMVDNSPECIAKNVIKVLEHPNPEEITKNARALVEKEFTYEAAVERYRKILENLGVKNHE